MTFQAGDRSEPSRKQARVRSGPICGLQPCRRRAYYPLGVPEQGSVRASNRWLHGNDRAPALDLRLRPLRDDADATVDPPL